MISIKDRKNLKEGKEMKKILVVSIIFLTIFVVAGSASAWWVVRPHVHLHRFGVILGSPLFWGPLVLPPPVYYVPNNPPPAYSEPGCSGHWVWIQDRWEERRTPQGGIEQAWVPGYWRCEP